MSIASDILNQALDLPEGERAEVAHQLLLSLEVDEFEDQAEVDAAWNAEIKRRLNAIRSGEVQLSDWDDACC